MKMWIWYKYRCFYLYDEMPLYPDMFFNLNKSTTMELVRLVEFQITTNSFGQEHQKVSSFGSRQFVKIEFCDQPPSEGSGSLNPKEVAKSSGFQLDITTRRSQNTGWWSLDHSLLDIATNTGRYLLHKRQNLRSLNTRSLFMYWRRSVKGFAVAKARLAA